MVLSLLSAILSELDSLDNMGVMTSVDQLSRGLLSWLRVYSIVIIIFKAVWPHDQSLLRISLQINLYDALESQKILPLHFAYYLWLYYWRLGYLLLRLID